MYNYNFITVTSNDVGKKLIVYLAENFVNGTYTLFHKYIRKGYIKIDRKKVSYQAILQFNQQIMFPQKLQELPPKLKKKSNNKVDKIKYAKEIELIANSLVYKDEDFFAINKAVGIAVQGGSNIDFHIHGILSSLRFGNINNPLLLHRIDKGTSGVLLFARHQESANYLFQLFKERKIKKTYLGVVKSAVKIDSSGVIKTHLIVNKESGKTLICSHNEGKESVTHYKVLRKYKNYYFLQINPITGRKHQIRAHLSQVLNAPILGDFKYGFKGDDAFYGVLPGRRFYLHALSIEFMYKNTNLKITADLDNYFNNLLDNMV